MRGYNYYGITSTAFDTRSQNVRRVDFPALAYSSLFLENNPNKYLYINKAQS